MKEGNLKAMQGSKAMIWAYSKNAATILILPANKKFIKIEIKGKARSELSTISPACSA